MFMSKYPTFLLIRLCTYTFISSSGESVSSPTKKHIQWNEELYGRKSSNNSCYSYGRKIDFILKDNNNNELSMCEFKKANVSSALKKSQQVKNLRDNASIIYESRKVLNSTDSFIVNGIDFIGDSGYAYKLIEYEDVVVALPISKMIIPNNIYSFEEFKKTLETIYSVKVYIQ